MLWTHVINKNHLVADHLSKSNSINFVKADSSAIMCQILLARLKEIQNQVMQKYENQSNLIFISFIVILLHLQQSHQNIMIEDLVLLKRTQQNQQHEIMRYMRVQKETKKLWKMFENHEEIKNEQLQNTHLKFQQYNDELSSFWIDYKMNL